LSKETVTQQYHLAFPKGFPKLTGENQNIIDDKMKMPEASLVAKSPKPKQSPICIRNTEPKIHKMSSHK
jgi:hypothetical protein